MLEGFLGLWILIPESCQFEQGEAPVSGQTCIKYQDDIVSFEMKWALAKGKNETFMFQGTPDGNPLPFKGGDLIDEITINLVSPRELTLRGYYKGVEHMVAQRQLDDSGQAMRLTQVVHLGDEDVANVSVYRKFLPN